MVCSTQMIGITSQKPLAFSKLSSLKSVPSTVRSNRINKVAFSNFVVWF